MRTNDKYGRRMTDKQCVLCQYYGSIFHFTMYNHQTPVCHRCATDAILQATKPNYPVPTVLADVTFWTGKDNPFMCGTELIIWKHGYSRRTGKLTRTVSAIWCR